MHETTETITQERERAKKEGPVKKPVGTNRIHVSYPDSMKDRLEEIREETDKSSLSEVFRQALLFYALAYEEHKKGSDFLIRTEGGDIERLRMFL